MEIYVLPRIHKRHPELTAEDVISAFRSTFIEAQRENGTWVCIGLDRNGRNVEMVYAQEGDGILIYRAMTPPTKKTRKELNDLGGRR